LDWKKALEVFEVPKSTLRDKFNSKETDIEKLSIPEALLFCNVEEDQYDDGELATRSVKRMAFELDIKIVLPSIFSTKGKSRLEVAV
jgi:hypothetical protein